MCVFQKRIIYLQIYPSCPSANDNAIPPEVMVGVSPPSEDDFAIESYFAACSSMEEYLTAGILKDCNS